MINIILNGKKLQVSTGITLNSLAKANGFESSIVIWVNNKKVLLAQYGENVLNTGDMVIIRRVLGGG